MSIHKPSPFDTGCDEAAEHKAFEDLCGGPSRAFRLLHVWQNTSPSVWHVGDPYYKSRNEIFRRKAKREGFSDTEINAFLHLQ